MDASPLQIEPTSAPVVAYASFLTRFRALVLDAVVMLAAALFIVFAAAAVDVAGTGRVAMAAIVALFILYEPLMVARSGATLGHRWANLRVVSERTGSSPGFWRAFLRFVVKSVLGLPSFVFMALTRKHQALHDRVAGTTVRIHELARAGEMDVAWERSDAELEPTGIPSRSRRVLVTLAYVVAFFAVLSIVSSVLASEACILANQCTAAENLRLEIGGLVWLGASAVCVIAGWRGRLWGARVRVPPIDAPGA